jgi:hypothetical protein
MLRSDQGGEPHSHAHGSRLEANRFEAPEVQSQLSDVDGTQTEQVRECRGWKNECRAILRQFAQGLWKRRGGL